ncbi:MAG: hypothetical protein WBC51_10305 [Vicinamibacterales bacterium]
MTRANSRRFSGWAKLAGAKTCSDGNGRIARLLTLLLLYHENYRVGRYVSLERIVEQSKQTYYEALERSSQGWHVDRHDVHP